MKKIARTVAVFLLISAALISFAACDNGSSGSGDDCVLLFSDDFDTLDTSVWNVYDNGVRKGGYWVEDMVSIEDGHLVIRTEERDGKYYTGAIDTDDKFERAYGYYEARVYLPEAYGIWSAFWIMCNSMGVASTDAKVAGTEIDIYESPYYAPTNVAKGDYYQSALHIGNYDSSDKTAYKQKTFLNFLYQKYAIIYGDWHVFSLDWQQNYYRFYLDGGLMFETDMAGNISDKEDSFLFLSVEVDGSNGNAYQNIFQIATKDISENAENAFPCDFLVDYVRVYDKMPKG